MDMQFKTQDNPAQPIHQLPDPPHQHPQPLQYTAATSTTNNHQHATHTNHNYSMRHYSHNNIDNNASDIQQQ
eukprot:8556534-Lingulodinium_polyedra.AAC.1